MDCCLSLGESLAAVIVLSMKSNRRLIAECSDTGVFMLLDWQKVTGSDKEIELVQDAVSVAMLRRVACLLRAFVHGGG